jgi:hypothetical protein
MELREIIESRLLDFLDDLDNLDEISDVLLVKAKLECLKIASEVIVKVKPSESTNVTKLPSFRID